MTLQLPATLDEAEMIDAVSQGVARVKEHMSPEYLEAKLCDGLRRGTIETLQVVEAANGGDHFADAALRRVYFEMEDRGEATPATLKAYGLKAALRGPVKRKAGGYTKYDKLGRDIGIAVLVYLTHRRFHLLPTRDRELSRRQRELQLDRNPSACGIVHAALARQGIHISESRIENIWAKMQGHIAIYLFGDPRTSPSII